MPLPSEQMPLRRWSWCEDPPMIFVTWGGCSFPVGRRLGSITFLPRFVRLAWRPRLSSRSGGLLQAQRRCPHGRTREKKCSRANEDLSEISLDRQKQGACRLPNAERCVSVSVIFPRLPATATSVGRRQRATRLKRCPHKNGEIFEVLRLAGN